MQKVFSCNKICLKADEGKMLYNASIDTYTPKAYLFVESEKADWTEVDISEVPQNDEITDTEALAIITGGAV